MENQASMKQTGRNYGIDALRLFSMFMVVVLHVDGLSGILDNSNGWVEKLLWFFEIASYCAVDCFAIVSGYVGYREVKFQNRFRKFLSFWISVVFYTFGITLVEFFLRPGEVSLYHLFISALPISTPVYWYVSAYAGLFLVMPWLNRLVMSSKWNTRKTVLAFAGFFLFQSIPAVLGGDTFELKGGYSCLWLIILYVLGAWMKKEEIPEKVRKANALLVAAGCVFLVWGCIIGYGNSVFCSYTSLPIVCEAVCFVIIFAKMTFSKFSAKLISFFAPAAFGVYVIHLQEYVWAKLKIVFDWIKNLVDWKVPGTVIVASICIFVGCLLIERVRITLFEKLRINRFISFAADNMQRLVRRFI